MTAAPTFTPASCSARGVVRWWGKPRPDLEAELLRLLDGGRQLEAVKLYKERRGVSLMEAKQAVESLAARHGLVTQRAGCMGMVLAVALATVRAAASLGMTMY